MRCFSALLCVLWTTVLTEKVPTRYNSSDLSYFSNGIQFPAPEGDLQEDASMESRGNTPHIRWLKELFDHFKWVNSLELINNTDCRAELVTYLNELQNGTSWAIKMYDASGRYSGLFFFGNDYWLGSKLQCDEVTNVETNPELPPFPIGFHVAKVRININDEFTPVTRQLNVGECLPASCTGADIKRLFMPEQRPGTRLNIVGIRPIPGDYQAWNDPKFQILGGVAAGIGVLLVIASVTELVLNSTKRTPDVENNNNNNEETKTPERKKKQQNFFLRLLLAFSAISNGKKILTINQISDESIRCVHGLRFFSIAWIILVHTFLELFAIADNKSFRILTERTFLYQTISNASFSVDTFFFISGLLVTITYFRSAAKRSPKEPVTWLKNIGSNFLKFALLLLYRFFRLTPAYLFVLGANEVVMRYLHSYSVFSPAIIDHISCSEFWWRNALYINNFFPQTEFCMLWSWYIANDTQMYIVSALLLLIATSGKKSLKFAAGAIGIFLVASWISTFVIATKYQYTVKVEEPFALFDQLYDKPWMRIGPYFIGMAAGYFLFKVEGKISLPYSIVLLGWAASIACLASLVYGVGREGIVLPLSALYASLGHTAWGLSLAWITIACASGYGGPLNSLFSSKFLLPLSRLTYCAYLVHPVLMCYISFVTDGPVHTNALLCVVGFLGNLVVSFLAAFGISLAFEAPIVNLLKIFLR